MINSISGNPALNTVQLDQNTGTPKKPTTEASNTPSFGPAVEINLSKEALAFLESEGVTVDDLSEKALKDLGSLFNQIDTLFETAGDAPLSAEQEKQLAGLEKKVESIVGPLFEEEDFFAGLSDEAAGQLEKIFDQIDQIFDTAGDAPLNAKQEEQLEALQNKVDNLLGEDIEVFEGLSEQATKDLDAIFTQIDHIFERAGENPLTDEQEKQLNALNKKIDSILDQEQEASEPDFFEGLTDKATKELTAIFDQIDHIFEQTSDNPLTAEQEKQLELLDHKITKILSDQDVS